MVNYHTYYIFTSITSGCKGMSRIIKFQSCYFNSLITPFNILIVTQLHLWFINPPNGVYGFTAHYIPYYLFQWALSLQLILNVGYYINTNEIPFGLPRCAAIFFMLVFIGLTLISQ